MFDSRVGFPGQAIRLTHADFQVLRDAAMATIFWFSIYQVYIRATW